MGFSVDKEIAMLRVVDECARVRVVIFRVAHLVFVDPEVVMQEDANLSFLSRSVGKADPAKKSVVMARDRIVTFDDQSELTILESNFGDECFRQIFQTPRPAIRRDPR